MIGSVYPPLLEFSLGFNFEVHSQLSIPETPVDILSTSVIGKFISGCIFIH